MYYTYVLQSEKDNNLYVGFTKNLKLRFEMHSKSLVESTRDRRPLKLVYYEACLSQDDATRREKYLGMGGRCLLFNLLFAGVGRGWRSGKGCSLSANTCPVKCLRK